MENNFRSSFPFFEENKNTVYLDSANTTQILVSSLSDMVGYYVNNNFNIGRSSYDGARNSMKLKEWATEAAAVFLGTKSENIVFTSGATEGLNIIAHNCYQLLKTEKEDKIVVLTTELEHASAILPWMLFGKNLVEIKYIKLNEDYELTLEETEKAFKEYHPDVLVIASMTNTTGEIRPLRELGEIAEKNNAYFVVDHSQGASHIDINVEEYKINFLSFSLHKMYGPKGVGVLYSSCPMLLFPIKFGGGMNKTFDKNGNFELMDDAERMYAGTENVPGIFASIRPFEFLIQNKEEIKYNMLYLSMLTHRLLSKIPEVKIYSKMQSPIILFNIEGIEALDVMEFLNKRGIYIRAGNHCAKLTKELFGLSTCRVSLGIYNTQEDIFYLYKAIKEIIKKRSN